MVFVEKIEARLIVDFHVADAYFKLRLGVFRNVTKDIGQRSRDDPAVSVPFCASCDCEGLARPGLAISEDGSIVTLEARINNIFRDFIKNPFLLGHHVENAVECELVVVIFYFIVTQAISLEVELYLPLISLQTYNKLKQQFLPKPGYGFLVGRTLR